MILVTGIFFWALRHSSAETQLVSVPLVNLDLNASSVLAAGGTVIAFAVLAAIGAVHAWSHALKEYAPDSWRTDAERLDTHPNALDLAIYAWLDDASLVGACRNFVYPLYLAFALVEAAWLQYWLWHHEAPGRLAFLVGGGVIGLRAAWLVGRLFVERFQQARAKRKQSSMNPSRSGSAG